MHSSPTIQSTQQTMAHYGATKCYYHQKASELETLETG